MPSDKLTELGIRKSKSGIKEKKLYDGQGLYSFILMVVSTGGSSTDF